MALTILPDYWIAVTFNDGRQGIADLSGVRAATNCGIFEALKDLDYFSRATLELGVVTWPNGTDLDPAWLYQELRDTETWPMPFWRVPF